MLADLQMPAVPRSPGVGARRKGPKALPRLPLSAFSPPNSGVSDVFPLPPSPSTVHPDVVIDAYVVARQGSVDFWTSEAGQVLQGRSGGIVVSLQGTDPADIEKAVETIIANPGPQPIVSLLVPFPLESGIPSTLPSFLSSPPKIPIALSTTFAKFTPKHAEGVRWALDRGITVDVDVQTELKEGESGFEGLDDLLGQTLQGVEQAGPKGKLVLSNILPPTVPLTIPIVKLITHPIYRAYQAHIATLSLFPSVYIKCLPPSWDAPTPHTPPPSDKKSDTKARKEWKRRIKMYLGPAVEAFGYQRIIFGSSPSPSSSAASVVGDWYELARESFAELGIEQEFVDALFAGNAKEVYGRA